MAINSIIAAPPLPRAATLTGSAATIALGSVCCAMDEFEVPVAGGENILDLWLLPPPPCSNPPRQAKSPSAVSDKPSSGRG